MERTLYGYHYDFVRQGGTRLQLSGTVPLRDEELLRIEWKMMENNDISGLLRLELEHIDMEVKLRYDITGLRMLSQQLAAERFSLPSYYRFLLRCANIIDEGKTYMLREEGFWLHEGFIFTSFEAKEEPKLLYVPSSRDESKPPVREQFKQLALRMSACIDRIEGDGFSGLLALLHRERFEFREVKKLLNGLLQAEPQLSENPIKPLVEPTRAKESTSAGLASGLYSIPPISAPQPAPEPSEHRDRASIPEWIAPPMADQDEPDLGELPGAEELPLTGKGYAPGPLPSQQKHAVNETLSSRQQLWIAAASCALLLLIWSFYPEEAPEGAQSVWIGLTILIVDFVFVWIRLNPRWLRFQQWQHMAQTVRAMEERDTGGLTGLLPNAKAYSSHRPAASFKGGADVPEKPDAHLQQPVIESLGGIQPSNDGATVWLPPRTGYIAEGAAADSRPWLERQDEGDRERLSLAEERYIIGREKQAVQYVLHEPGVSKLHLEITFEEGRYYAKDLGSKNGALWNDEVMVPYKLYPLEDGDRLTILQTVFVFKHPNSQRTVHP